MTSKNKSRSSLLNFSETFIGHIPGINLETLPQILHKLSWSQGLLWRNLKIALWPWKVNQGHSLSNSSENFVPHIPGINFESLESFQSFPGHRAYLQNNRKNHVKGHGANLWMAMVWKSWKWLETNHACQKFKIKITINLACNRFRRCGASWWHILMHKYGENLEVTHVWRR